MMNMLISFLAAATATNTTAAPSFGGGDFQKVYKAFGDDCTYGLNPAVRKPTGPCIEESNCNYEKVTLCAFSKANTTANNVAFLGCMDETKQTKDALAAAKGCTSSTTPPLDIAAVNTCYSGSEGDDLLKTASAVWNKAFPARATVPHVFVNGKNVEASYSAIKAAICAADPSAKGC